MNIDENDKEEEEEIERTINDQVQWSQRICVFEIWRHHDEESTKNKQENEPSTPVEQRIDFISKHLKNFYQSDEKKLFLRRNVQ